MPRTGFRGGAAVIRNRLKRIQYRPDLFAAFLAQTGLALPAELGRQDHL
jgi:hypothetical protein